MKKKITETDLPSRAVAVYKLFVDMMDKDFCCFPSVKYIARMLHLSVATVKRAINDLKDRFIKVTARVAKDTNTQSSNLYTVISLEKEEDEEKREESGFVASKIEEIERCQRSVEYDDKRVYNLKPSSTEAPSECEVDTAVAKIDTAGWKRFIRKMKKYFGNVVKLANVRGEPRGVQDDPLIEKLINTNIGKRSSYNIGYIRDIDNNNYDIVSNTNNDDNLFADTHATTPSSFPILGNLVSTHFWGKGEFGHGKEK
ncbi:helix-turn-helix domain-containing protein [Bacteroides heparinolyticus]|uniref:helix-turn-helix domain-containing protein n=1 Tax=Prevotella heparinolytica TaxID=28113 RepID=UPI0035A11EC1